MSVDFPETFNIADYFLGDRIREGMGDRRALLTDEGPVTYAELDELSNRFGNLLLKGGVRPEERVIVSVPDSAEYVVALFGILKIGAVVVMVNPELKEDALRYFRDYTRATAAIVGEENAAIFRRAPAGAHHRCAVVRAGGGRGDLASRLRGSSPALETFPSHRDDAAIWLFSGGTTGRPKAVIQSHTSFANTTELYGKGTLEMGPEDITLSVPKLYFGYATGSNLFFPFSVGAAAALFPERCTVDAFFRRIAQFRPTVLINVPTMINHMINHPRAAERDLSSVRLSTSAGEALPPELHERWNDLFGVDLLDGLGTAEMWHIFISNRPGEVRPGTLGKVVPGFEVRVRDEEGRDLPAGEVGHLWVRGNSRAIGYWQRAEKTRSAFRGEWYVSEDMISRDAEGFIHYRGRADDMLKVSGKWLSPQELENCLLQHPRVKEVAVVGVTGSGGLTKPHAFVVAEGPDPELAEELRCFAKERLEPYKYPREVAFLAELPRTHLGKVDRGGLGRAGL